MPATLHARVNDAGTAVTETRVIDLATVPTNKQLLWRPVTGTEPSFDPDTHTISGPTDTIETTQVVRSWTVTAKNIDAVKSDLKQRIDNYAEGLRAAFLTIGSGMAIVYAEKFSQAAEINAMGQTAADAMTPQDRLAQFPLINASIGIDGATLWNCSQIVIAANAAANQSSFAIEVARLGGKKAVSDAVDVTLAKVAYGAITWPT